MVGSAGRPTRRFEGRDALEAFCIEINKSYTGMHFLDTPELEFDGSTARARVHFEFKYVVRLDPTETTHGSQAGYYDVTYVKTPVGWRMKERIEKGVVRQLTTFYDL